MSYIRSNNSYFDRFCFRIKISDMQKICTKALIGVIYVLIVNYLHLDWAMMCAILLVNIWCLLHSKNLMLFIINFFILYSNYSISFYFYLKNGMENASSIPKGLLYREALILYIFSLVVFIIYPDNKKEKNENNSEISFEHFVNSSYIIKAKMLIIILLLFSIFAILSVYITGDIILPFYGHLPIIFVFALEFSRANINLQKIIKILMIVNIFLIFSIGSRGDAIVIGIVLLSYYYRNKIKKIFMLATMFFGIIFLNGIGMWRRNFDFTLSLFSASFYSLIQTGFILTTACSAENAGLSILNLRDVLTMEERIKLGLNYILYTFIGEGLIGQEEVNLSVISKKYMFHYGGGTLPNYGYFYLGYLGVVLLALLVSYYLHIIANIETEQSSLKKCIAIYITSSVMSWYLYSPSPLIRGVLIIYIFYMLWKKVTLKLDV